MLNIRRLKQGTDFVDFSDAFCIPLVFDMVSVWKRSLLSNSTQLSSADYSSIFLGNFSHSLKTYRVMREYCPRTSTVVTHLMMP